MIHLTPFLTQLTIASFMLSDPISEMITKLETTMKGVAASFAVIGVLGLSFMYLGSSLPIVSDWKASHPKAASDVTVGLVLLTLIGSGTLATMVSLK